MDFKLEYLPKCLLHSYNLPSVIVRGIMKRIPVWLWKRIVYKMYSSRFQCSFLPLVEDKALIKPSYQCSLHKTLSILQNLANNPSVIAIDSNEPATIEAVRVLTGTVRHNARSRDANKNRYVKTYTLIVGISNTTLI